MPCWFLEMDSSFALLTSLEAKGGLSLHLQPPIAPSTADGFLVCSVGASQQQLCCAHPVLPACFSGETTGKMQGREGLYLLMVSPAVYFPITDSCI